MNTYANSINNNSIQTININKLRRDAHWTWFKEGWNDFKNSFAPSMVFGGGIVLFSWIFIISLYSFGYGAFIPAATGAFALIAPLLASFIYAIAKALERNHKVTSLKQISFKPVSASQIGFIGFFLAFAALVWFRTSAMLYAVARGAEPMMTETDFLNFVLNTPQGTIMALVGVGGGAIIAIIVFVFSAISIPLCYEKKIDAFSAMALSAKAFAKNKTLMFSWGFVIALSIAFSAVMAFVPLLVIFPWLGHVTWRAYRDLTD